MLIRVLGQFQDPILFPHFISVCVTYVCMWYICMCVHVQYICMCKCVNMWCVCYICICIYVCLCVCVCVHQHMCEGQRTTCGSWVSPSTMFHSGNETQVIRPGGKLPTQTSWQPLSLLFSNSEAQRSSGGDFRDESHYLPFTLCHLQMYVSPNELKIGDQLRNKIILASILFPKQVLFDEGRGTFAQQVW